MDQFITELRTEVAAIASLEPDNIADSATLLGDLGLDSIMLLDLLAKMSARYPELAEISPAKINLDDETTYAELEAVFLSAVGALGVSNAPTRSGLANLPKIREFLAYYQKHADMAERTYLRPHENTAGRTIVTDGKEYLNFASYNYLGTNGHPEVLKAVEKAIGTYGTSVSASRLVSGEIPLHGELERAIATYLGVDDALVQVSGHATNVGLLGTILGANDLILYDSLAHNSILQGTRMSVARRKPFKHNDPEALRSELERVRARFEQVLVVTEGVYSMDGDICALPEILEVCEEYDAMLMIDEAHSFGTIGEAGAGVCSYYGIDPKRIDILMGTLSKSLNSCGGYLAGSHDFVTYLRYNLPGFVFSVGMTPSDAAAALSSLELMRRNPEWVEELAERAESLRSGLRGIGGDIGLSANTPIVPLILGDSGRTRALSYALRDVGINVDPITYPAVKNSEARLRFFISRTHTESDITRAVSAVAEAMAGKLP